MSRMSQYVVTKKIWRDVMFGSCVAKNYYIAKAWLRFADVSNFFKSNMTFRTVFSLSDEVRSHWGFTLQWFRAIEWNDFFVP